MADLGRLQHAVAGHHPERLPLILVDDLDPSGGDEDHLEANPVEMHPIGNIATLLDPNVARDEPPTPPVGKQIAVLHPGASDAEAAVLRVDHGQARHALGDIDRRRSHRELDDRTAR